MTPDLLAMFGTGEPPPERIILRAGPLEALLEAGNLRQITFHNVEVLRAVSYLARDSQWGTCAARLGPIDIRQEAGHFSVRYEAVCESAGGRFAYRAEISGAASGDLEFRCEGRALTDFTTNRTGFVILHPAEAAGGKLAIGHSGGGGVEETVFPDLISPDQPAFDIRSMQHEPAPGLNVSLDMVGDAFEMEDQRNWADASFKTYVRPLAKPRPYVIAKDSWDIQSVRMSVTRKPVARAAPDETRTTVIETYGQMPEIYLFAEDGANIEDALAPQLRGLANGLTVRHDIAAGHNTDRLRRLGALAEKQGWKLDVEAVFDMCDPDAETSQLASDLSLAGIAPTAIRLAPRREFKTRPSRTLPEGEVSVAAMTAAVRSRFPQTAIAAGSVSNFTEFNRNPPAGDFDAAFFGGSAIVHAADDKSVMETASVYTAILRTAAALCPNAPLWLGPLTLACRHNPYGNALLPNPSMLRISAAGDDPRHKALFGAAYAGALAAQVAGRVEKLSLASLSGSFDLLREDGSLTPLGHLHQHLAEAAGSPVRIAPSLPDGLVAFRWEQNSKMKTLVINVTDTSVTLPQVHGLNESRVLKTNGGFQNTDSDWLDRPVLQASAVVLLGS